MGFFPLNDNSRILFAYRSTCSLFYGVHVQELPVNFSELFGNSSVTELVLSNNSIAELSNRSLSSLPASLRLLALDGNNLRELDAEVLAVLDGLVTNELRQIRISLSPSSVLHCLLNAMFLLKQQCAIILNFFLLFRNRYTKT